MKKMMGYDVLRYHIVPPLFVVFFTFIIPVLVVLGSPDRSLSFESIISSSLLQLRDPFAWKVVLFFYVWAFLSLKIPGKDFYGPAAPFGYVPRYRANGTQYYLLTMSSFLAYSLLISQDLCLQIAEHFAGILSVLNVTSLMLCGLLMLKAFFAPEAHPEDPQVKACREWPIVYQFYRGIELHPRILDVDVKQWTNCRVGMMGWALLVTAFCIAGNVRHGINPGSIANALLINIYLLKFFYWETGYFNTLDITLDRAGYYLCWGCLCWVQAFYTFAAYFMSGHPCLVSSAEAFVIFLLGSGAITLNYICDRQKEVFRNSSGRCYIWGRKATFQEVTYKNHLGKQIKSKLLTSGFWGLARHTNYVFELLVAASWSLPAAHYGLLPFMYVIFLAALLFHRTFRDEEKCAAKYGSGWQTYCKTVPYRFIPYVY